MQKHIILLMFIMAAIMVISFNNAQAAEATGDEKREPLVEIGVAGACLPPSCQSYGCCSGNCGSWCRQCGIAYVCR